MNGDWRDLGRCAEVDPELFFPEKGGSVKEPKRICRRCEVRPECLAWALAQPLEVPGIWGGTSFSERRRMRQGLAA